MGFLSTAGIRLYLTKLAKNYLVNGSPSDLVFSSFSLGDSDYNYTNQTPKTEFMPELGGGALGCLVPVPTNIDIKHIIPKDDTEQNAILYDSGRGFINVDIANSDVKSLATLNFTIADRTDNTTENNHLFKSLNLPVTLDEQLEFSNTFGFTALRDLNKDKILVLDIPSAAFGDLIKGQTIDLRIPNGSQPNSYYHINSSYMYDSTNTRESYNNLISDNNDFSQYFGQTKTVFDPNNTNIAYLFSDDIQPPVSKGFTNNISWKTQNLFINDDPAQGIDDANVTYEFGVTNGTNKFKNLGVYINGSETNYNSPTLVDTAIGIIYLDKGLLVITNEDIVDNFILYKENNGFPNDTKDIALNSSDDIYLTFKDTERVYRQTATIVILANEFTKSNNPTYTSGNIYITEFGLYNSNDELIAIGKLDTPLEKSVATTLYLHASITI